jgi:hypothetical protein
VLKLAGVPASCPSSKKITERKEKKKKKKRKKFEHGA